jgi:predicted nucleic acid-binding protein
LKRQAKNSYPRELKGRFLLDADVFISYISGDELADHAEKAVKYIVEDALEAFVSSMLYDDVISGLRSKGMDIQEAIQVLTAIASIPHTSLPVTPAIAISALTLIMKHGAPRKIHYFDTFHVATATLHELPIITSDTYINQHQNTLGVTTFDLKEL